MTKVGKGGEVFTNTIYVKKKKYLSPNWNFRHWVIKFLEKGFFSL